MRDRFGATNPRAQALRFHAQTGGSTLTAQQPENNIVRVAIQALSAVCGGAQSLHTNSFDEALALPTERAATIALRTQQILAAEAGTTDTADPLGGSYFIEALTDELEAQARELIARIDELGGAVAAIEQGFVQAEIEASAFRLPGRRGVRRARRRRRERASPTTERSPSSSSRSIPRSSAASANAPLGFAQSETATARRRRSRRFATSRCPRPTSCRRCARRCVPAARSARSAASCASFGVHMTPSMRSADPLRDRCRRRPRARHPARGAGDGAGSGRDRGRAQLRARRRADHRAEVRRAAIRRAASRRSRSRPRSRSRRARLRSPQRSRRDSCRPGRRARSSPAYVGQDGRVLSAGQRAAILAWARAGGKIDGPARKPAAQKGPDVRAGRVAPEPPHAGRVQAVGAEGRDRRLPLLPPRPEADGGLVRHVRPHRAGTAQGRAPRDPLPRSPPAQLAEAKRLDAATRARAGRASAAPGSRQATARASPTR